MEDEYGGFRINVKGTFEKIRTNFFIEITTGDVITPREIEYKYNSIFEEREINIMAYTVETIIAEKFDAIISKNITTTRAKDFYDIYVLVNYYIDNINKDILIKAIKRTFENRNTNYEKNYLIEIFEIIKNSVVLKELFINYSKKLIYAKDITYEDTIKTIYTIIELFD